MVPPVVDHDFSQFSALPASDLRPTVEESMVGEQLKMLSYADYALAVGLRSTDATGAEAADSVDQACEAIQVGLRAIEHAAGIALKVCANLELAKHDSALAGFSFDSDTKAQLRTLPLGHEELFGGKLDKASKQAEERGRRQHVLKVLFEVPQVQSQATSVSAPNISFQASGRPSSQSRRGLGKGKSKKGRGRGRGSTSSGVTVSFENPQAQPQGQSNKNETKDSGRGRGRGRGRGARQP